VAETTLRKTSRPRRVLVGACLGNAVEWYDFAIYGAFATVLADTFFPHGGPAALATTFAIFATSFVARPLGAVIVGRHADHVGRRLALTRTIALMTVATVAIGLLPTWSTAGVLAPVALLLLRVVQGFATGGEVPSSVAFLIESAPAGRRGRFGGWHMASIAAGLVAGYGVAGLLAAILSDDALRSWGWRVAFLVAAPLGLVARYIRHRLDETPGFHAAAASTAPRALGEVLRGRGAVVGRGLVLVAALGLAFNLWFVFLPSHLAASGVLPLGQALGAGIVGLIVTVASAPAMGALSDRVGRRPLLIAGTVGIAAFAGPGFLLARSSVEGALVSQVVMGVLIGTPVATAFVAELFPAMMRTTGIALTYGLATAVFGGTAPLVATLLVGAGAAWVIPAYLATVAGFAFVAVARADETAFLDLS
jgi:MHS family proline/betaine transporter-like MFS transporter